MNSVFIQLLDTILKQHSEFAQCWMDDVSLTCSSRLAKVGILLVNAKKCSLYRESTGTSNVQYELLQELLGTCAIHYLCSLDPNRYYIIPKENRRQYLEIKHQLESNLNCLKRFDIWKEFAEWAVRHDLESMTSITEQVFTKWMTH